jgi:hypothetical protein
MRFTLFVSLVAALMAIPCLVLREVKPPLHPLPAGCHLRALLGLVSGVFIAMKSANKLTPDGRLAAILVGTILFAASSVFFFGKIEINLCVYNDQFVVHFKKIAESSEAESSEA